MNHLEQALKRIVDPIAHLQEEAQKEGFTLDGHMAIKLSQDPEYLKGIAKKALLGWDSHTLPSRYQMHNIVSVGSEEWGFYAKKAEIIRILFSGIKVRYDLEVELNISGEKVYTRIYNVDSYWVSDYVTEEYSLPQPPADRHIKYGDN